MRRPGWQPSGSRDISTYPRPDKKGTSPVSTQHWAGHTAAARETGDVPFLSRGDYSMNHRIFADREEAGWMLVEPRNAAAKAGSRNCAAELGSAAPVWPA